jgi:hypothetical protein
MSRAHLVSAINLIFLLRKKNEQAFYNVLIMFSDHVRCTLRGKSIVDCEGICHISQMIFCLPYIKFFSLLLHLWPKVIEGLSIWSMSSVLNIVIYIEKVLKKKNDIIF